MKFTILFFVLCFSGQTFSKAPQKLSLFVYNVQNLFDVVHDKDKNDWTFLPKDMIGKKEECAKVTNKYYRRQCLSTDWNHLKLKMKLGQIKKVVDSVGEKIDLIALSEIENENVVSKLAKKLGYADFVVSNSPDKRGIDLALLYNSSKKLKKISQKEHVINGDYFKKKPTRNILEVEFLVGGKHRLNIFVNHWPSQGNPTNARIAAAKLLKKRISEILKEDSKRNIIATGDFNTIPKDQPHPFNDVIFKDHFLNDVRDITIASSITGDKGVEGTYFYFRGKVWNQLDRIMINKNLLDQKGMEFDVSSFKIYSPKLIKKIKKIGKMKVSIPAGYNFETMDIKDAGYSDHFPVYSEFTF